MAKQRDDVPFPEDPNDSDAFDPVDEDLAELTEDEDDGLVDLGESSGVEPSGTSLVEWASLVDEEAPDEEAGEIEELPPDDSEVDLGAPQPVIEDDLLLPPTSSAILNEADAGMFLEDDLDSESALPEDQLLSAAEEEVELDAPAELPRLPDVTGVNLGENEEEIFEPEVMGEASAVDLTGDELIDPEVVESSSGISITDMGIEEVPEDAEDHYAGEEIYENSGELVLEEIVQQESGAVDLGEEVLLGGESPSQRDLIAEAVESGVDLPEVQQFGEMEEVEEAYLEATSEMPVDDDLEMKQMMDDLVGSGDHPMVPEDYETTEALEQPPTEESETVTFEPPPSEEDSALRTGARIARPDSLGDLEWDDGAMAGEGPVGDLEENQEMEEFEEYTEETSAYPEEGLGEEQDTYEEELGEAPVDEQGWDEPEPEPEPMPAPKKGKKGGVKSDANDPDAGGSKKPVKARGTGGAWIGGTLFGLILGAGGLIGAGLSGYDPMPVVGNAVGIPVEERNPKPKPVVPPAPTFDDLAVALRSGDFEKANQVNVESLRIEKPEDKALLGQFRFQNHLQKQALAGGEIKADDEAIKQAVADLQEVKTADALLTLAQIQMTTGDLVSAEKTLQEGSAQFQDRRFTAAQTRLQLLKEEKPAPAPMPPAPMPPAPMPPAPPAPPVEPQARGVQGPVGTLMVAVLLGQPEPMQPPMPMPMPMPMQPPMPMPPAPAPELPEAGFDFWQAVKLAREQKFTEARAALTRAIELHEKRRFARLNKAQNPDSDPVEEIFLRACKELQVAWEAQESLKKGGYLVEKGDSVKALGVALKDAAEGKMTAQALAAAGAKYAEAKVIDKPEDLLGSLDKILVERTANVDKITKLEKDLGDAKKVNDTLVLDLATSKKQGEDLLMKLNASEKKLAETTLARDEANGVVNTATKMLVDARVAPEKADRQQFFKGMQEIIKTAEMKDPGGKLRMVTKDLADQLQKYERDTADLKADKVKALDEQKALNDKATKDLMAAHDKFVVDLKEANTKQVNGLNAQLKESRRAAEVLPSYLKALQERGTGLEASALEDVARVGRDPAATPIEKANAEVIRGLVLRNQNQFAESKETLEKGLMPLAKDSPFAVAGTKLLVEVTDPAAFVRQQVQDLQSRGRTDEALKLLQTGLDTLPPETRPSLLAQRSVLQLDELRRKTGGRFQLEDPALLAAQKDASASEAAGTAEGSFAAGRIAEELGQFNVAIEKYREAIKRHEKLDDLGARYRVALARALVQVSQPWTPPAGNPPKLPAPVEPGVEGKTSRIDPPGLRELMVLMVLGIQPGELIGSPNRAEAQKLADEILAMGNAAPFDLRAQALAIKGRWTEALTIYAEGLRGSLRGDLSEGLLLLIRNHPALKRDDSDRINPVEAERLYGQAVRLYFQRAYAEAEKLLLMSLEANDQDARTFYFLGLARLGQGKQDLAYASFEAGAQLERQSKPAAGAINSSLERVQGAERRILGQVRDRVER